MQRDVVEIIALGKGNDLLEDLQHHQYNGDDLNGDQAHAQGFVLEQNVQKYRYAQHDDQGRQQGFDVFGSP